MRGYTEGRDALHKRLRRIEGQVRGLQRMIDEDAYCIDILTQISAATRALEAVALNMLEDHLRHCVQDALAAGDADADVKITEAANAVRRLVRS
jgi:DNA-binding FrmR family transcriptional regulator